MTHDYDHLYFYNKLQVKSCHVCHRAWPQETSVSKLCTNAPFVRPAVFICSECIGPYKAYTDSAHRVLLCLQSSAFSITWSLNHVPLNCPSSHN
jgi:hypothetical protein